MRDIYPRPAREGDIALIDEWIRTTPQNMFDPGILEYADKLKFYCAQTEGQSLVFMPIQNVLMLESLAVQPGASDLEVSKAIGVLIQFIIGKAEELAYNEIYFIGKGLICTFASAHGWETVLHDSERDVTLFRWKVRKTCESTPSQ